VTVRNDRPPGALVQLQYRSSFLTPGFSTEHRNGRPPEAAVLLRNRSSFLRPGFSTEHRNDRHFLPFVVRPTIYLLGYSPRHSDLFDLFQIVNISSLFLLPTKLQF